MRCAAHSSAAEPNLSAGSGAIARRRGQVTTFGKVADPIADKALTGAALIGLSLLGDLPWVSRDFISL